MKQLTFSYPFVLIVHFELTFIFAEKERLLINNKIKSFEYECGERELSVVDRKFYRREHQEYMQKVLFKVASMPQYRSYFKNKNIKSPGVFLYTNAKDDELPDNCFDPLDVMKQEVLNHVLSDPNFDSLDVEGKATCLQVFRHMKFKPPKDNDGSKYFDCCYVLCYEN